MTTSDHHTRFHVRLRISPALVVATLALFVALGGTGYAVTKLPADSVTTREVKDHSLLSSDFAPDQLPAGPGSGTLAYGYVKGNGSLDLSRSAGLTPRMVSRTSKGTYCFHDDSLTKAGFPAVRNIMVTLDQQSVLDQGAQIFLPETIVASAMLNGCGKAEVDLLHWDGPGSASRVDRGFFVLFN